MKYIGLYREKIAEASNHDAEAEEFLRTVMERAARSAPLHSLIKMCQFFADEIYPDADRDAASEN